MAAVIMSLLKITVELHTRVQPNPNPAILTQGTARFISRSSALSTGPASSSAQ